MFRLKDILYLCDNGLQKALFIPIDSSKCAVEVRNGVAGFLHHANSANEEFVPVRDNPDIVEEWKKEFDPEEQDDKGNITRFEQSYLYILQPFYREVMDLYF